MGAVVVAAGQERRPRIFFLQSDVRAGRTDLG
jgi:hypothetical protein